MTVMDDDAKDALLCAALEEIALAVHMAMWRVHEHRQRQRASVDTALAAATVDVLR